MLCYIVKLQLLGYRFAVALRNIRLCCSAAPNSAMMFGYAVFDYAVRLGFSAKLFGHAYLLRRLRSCCSAMLSSASLCPALLDSIAQHFGDVLVRLGRSTLSDRNHTTVPPLLYGAMFGAFPSSKTIGGLARMFLYHAHNT